MNRRELAKNGFLGLCGFLAAKLLPEKAAAETMQLTPQGTDTNSAATVAYTYTDVGGNGVPPLWFGHDFSGPEWDDNKYWEKPISPQKIFTDNP